MTATNLRLAYALNFARRVLQNTTYFFLPLYFTGLGFQGWQTGLLLGLFTAMSLLGNFPVGALNDRLSVRKAVLAGGLASMAFYVLLPSVTDFRALLLLFCLGGLGQTLIERSTTSLAYKTNPEKSAPQKFGAYLLFSMLGSGTGIAFGGTLVQQAGFQTAFHVLALGYLLVVALALAIRPTLPFRFGLKDYGKELKRKEVLCLGLALFLYTLHWGAEDTSYALYLQHNLGLGLQASAWFMALPTLLLGFAAYTLGKNLSRQVSYRKLLVAGLLASGLGQIAFGSATGPAAAFGLRLVHEIGDAAALLGMYVAIHRLFPVEKIGGTSGLVLTATILGAVAGDALFGPLGNQQGYQWPFLVSGLLTLAAILPLLFAKNTSKAMENAGFCRNI